jgi:hypothetical protein
MMGHVRQVCTMSQDSREGRYGLFDEVHACTEARRRWCGERRGDGLHRLERRLDRECQSDSRGCLRRRNTPEEAGGLTVVLLFRARYMLRELQSAGLVALSEGRYSLTDSGRAKLEPLAR